jgi:hypothetical protein
MSDRRNLTPRPPHFKLPRWPRPRLCDWWNKPAEMGRGMMTNTAYNTLTSERPR